MNRVVFLAVLIGMVLGCGGAETGTGSGGSSGSATASSGEGGSGGQATTTSTGGGGSAGPVDVLPYEMSSKAIGEAIAAHDCEPVAPDVLSNGAWAKVVSRPGTGTYGSLRFAATDSPATFLEDPWILGIKPLSADFTAADTDCESATPAPFALSTVDTFALQANGEAASVNILEAVYDAVDVAAGDALLLCVRQSYADDGSTTGPVMCGAPHGNPQRDFWQNPQKSNGTSGISYAMCDVDASFCGTWMVVPL